MVNILENTECKKKKPEWPLIFKIKAFVEVSHTKT